MHTHFPSGDMTGDSSERRGAGFLADVLLLAAWRLVALEAGAGLLGCLAGGLCSDLPEVLL